MPPDIHQKGCWRLSHLAQPVFVSPVSFVVWVHGFATWDSDQQATEMLNYALDHGLYYLDTAWASDNTLGLPPGRKKNPRYISSEVRMWPVVNARRKEIFLSTKVSSRDPDEAMRQIETSLRRLQTDHLDQLMIHDVTTMDDVNKLSEKGNLIEILHRCRDQGLTRFIGFSGQSQAAAMKEMAVRLAPFYKHENLPWMQAGYLDGHWA
ncbi:MAG: aldo/keto reductase [Bacteroidota bacterium]